MTGGAEHCSFVLLADFDIDRGALLTYQFPQPLGTDETLLANLMLPDGAERQPEDWTIFFLNQRPFNTIAPVLALEAQEDETEGRDEEKAPELIYVLNLVRTKLDKTVRRGAIVKAMAICTRHSFIEIFKPVLLMALDDYFMNPSQDCLARLFDAVNSMDISMAPTLSRFEKLIMRTSERKDVFIEKFEEISKPATSEPPTHHPAHRSEGSIGSQSSFEDGILTRSQLPRGKDRDVEAIATGSATSLPSTTQYSPSDASFSLDGSAVWVESGFDQSTAHPGTSMSTVVNSTRSASMRGRKSTDASSSSSHNHGRRDESSSIPAATASSGPLYKDTHVFPATIDYNDHQLPIRLPMDTFQEEVGDYSLIQLVQTFSAPTATITGPMHPHLHTSGHQTHPIMILFNALVTGKRIIFLGHHRPAGQVASYVLSACALGSGCGIVLRGLIKRAFPYANLINKEEWESTPAYIAGVTNPIFEASVTWDLLCDVGAGRMVISKDIHQNYPAAALPSSVQLIARSGTLKAEGSLGSEEEFSRPSKDLNVTSKAEFVGKADTADNVFMEDIISAISLHYGEAHVRARFTEYSTRFVRLAARYEEDVLGLTTNIGYPSAPYSESPGEEPKLGSGLAFTDEAAGVRELAANASRIEAWRRTESYTLWEEDFNKLRATNPIQGVDISHQLWRLRHSKHMPDGEAILIYRTLAENIQTYDQVTELLSLLPPHHYGLLPLSFGLFHQQEAVRDLTVEIFNELRSYAVGVQFLQALNHFQRYAYVRQAHARESRILREQNTLTLPPSIMSRTPSNRSESSLNGG
ncbi:spindle pole body interacting protein [Trametopsis cervina]|nr:spindle pole body interacting protein [Trametopsis cervina]